MLAGARRMRSSTGRVPRARGRPLAAAIRGWEHLRFEVSEDPTPRSDGGRWLHTPGLGIHYAQTDTAGNVVIGEDRIRYAMEVAAGDAFELQPRALGRPRAAAWDDELEPFRHASDDAPVRLARTRSADPRTTPRGGALARPPACGETEKRPLR